MKKTNIKIILSIAVIVIAFSVYRVFKPTQGLEKTSPDYILTSEQILEDFNLDEEKANQKYVGKIVLIKGSIDEIIKNEKQTIITLRTNDPFSVISCKLSEKENIEPMLKKNQSISIKGECSGKLLDIVFINCSIITNK